MALRGVDLRGVLLDAHGTLVSLEPPAPALTRVLRSRFGVTLTEAQASRAIAAEIEFYRAHLGEGRDDASVSELRGRCAGALREALAAERVLDAVGADELTEALLESLVFRVFDEVPGVLRKLRSAGLRLVVASNWDFSLRSTLDRLGLLSLVDGVVCSAAVGAAKPDARLFEAALQVAGMAAFEAAHVGDSIEEDVVGARAAGIRPVLVSRDGAAPGGPAGAAPGRPAGAAPRGRDGTASPGIDTISSLAELPRVLGLTP